LSLRKFRRVLAIRKGGTPYTAALVRSLKSLFASRGGGIKFTVAARLASTACSVPHLGLDQPSRGWKVI